MATKAPEPRLIRTWQDAEDYAAEYTRWLGWADARATRRSGDEGIDVIGGSDGDIVVAQVKMEVTPIESKVVRDLRGAGVPAGANHFMMFALAGYKTPAVDWANRADVALFEFAYDGTITATNEHATQYIARASAPGRRSNKKPPARAEPEQPAPARPVTGPYTSLHPIDLSLLSAVERWEQPNRTQLDQQSMFPGLMYGDLALLAGVTPDDVLRAYPMLRKLTETAHVNTDPLYGVLWFGVLGIRDSGLRALRAWNVPLQGWRG